MGDEWVFSKGHQTNIQQSHHMDHLGNNNKKMNLFIEGSPYQRLGTVHSYTRMASLIRTQLSEE